MIKKYTLFFFFFFVWFFFLKPLVSFAQHSKNISVENGLPSNSVRVLYKANNGLLWIGTDDGLCSYDGNEIKVYNQKNGLPSNEVWSIVEDEKGHLVLGCYNGGICFYDGNEFTSFTEKDGLPSNKVRQLYYKDSLLFIATDSKLTIYDGNKFYYKASMMQVMSINQVNQSIYAITRAMGVYKIDYDIHDLPNFRLDSCFWKGTLFGAASLKNGLLLLKNKELNYLENDHFQNCNISSKDFLSNSISWDACMTNDGSIYLAQWGIDNDEGGLYKIENNKTQNIGSLFDIKSKKIFCTYYDELNNMLWVGSLDKGIYVIYLDNKISYIELSNDYNKINQINSRVISLKQDKSGKVWFLADNSLYILNNNQPKIVYSSEFFKNLIRNNSDWKKKIAKSKSNENIVLQELENLRLQQLEIIENDIYIGSDHGLFCYNITTKKIRYAFVIGSEFYVDDKENLTLQQTYSYLCKYENVFGSKDQTIYNDPNMEIPFNVTGIVKYKGNLWYTSSSEGLIKQQDSTFIFFKKNKIIDESNVNNLLVVNDSIIVFSSQSGNVYGISENDNEIKIHFKYVKGKEIIGSYIYFLILKNRNLYVGTNLGLNVLGGELSYFFDKSEGYFENEVFCAEVVDSLIYLGTKKGITILSPKLGIVKNSNKIELISLKTVDTNYLINRNLETPLILDYNRNYFTLDFVYPNLINHKKDQFSISFEYLDSEKKWSISSNAYKDPNKSTIRFLNLSPGKYRIAIAVKNYHNNEYLESDYFYFTINPPYWKTWPFYIIVTIALVLIIVFLISKKVEEITEREKANRRIAEVRMEALKSQMNPHFTFNVMNAIQNYVVENDIDQALYFIGSFSKLVRSTLDYSFKKNITIEQEVKFLKNYFEIQNMRFENKVKMELIFPKRYATKVKLPPMLIQPLIENVFVHAFNEKTKNPLISLEMKVDGEISDAKYLLIKIKDNGVGKSKVIKSNHESRGSQIIMERLTLLNSYNDVDSLLDYKDVEIGTEVQLRVPLILSF